MNMNQIINMVLRMVMRKAMNKGINMGMQQMSKSKDRRQPTPEQSDVDRKKMQQTAKLSRRINRF